MPSGRLAAVLAAGQRQRNVHSTGTPESEDPGVFYFVPHPNWAMLAEEAAAEAAAAERKGFEAKQAGAAAVERGKQALEDVMEASASKDAASDEAAVWQRKVEAEMQKILEQHDAGNDAEANNAVIRANQAFIAMQTNLKLVERMQNKITEANKRAEQADVDVWAAYEEAKVAAKEARAAAARAAEFTAKKEARAAN